MFAVKVACSADGEVSAWRVSDHQIPPERQHILDRLLQVPARIGLAIQQITAPCVVATAPESIAHAGAVFAGN